MLYLLYQYVWENPSEYKELKGWLYTYGISIKISWIGSFILEYSKISVKLPLKNRQNKDLNDKW